MLEVFKIGHFLGCFKVMSMAMKGLMSDWWSVTSKYCVCLWDPSLNE